MSSPSSATLVAISMLNNPSLNMSSISVCCFWLSPVSLFLACPTNTFGSAPSCLPNSSDSLTAVSLYCVNSMIFIILSFCSSCVMNSTSAATFGCSGSF